MTRTFKSLTKGIVDRFLHSILFVDDRAYQSDAIGKNSFNAGQISNIFAQKGKLCTIFAPTNEKDLDNCMPLFAKSDVIVLDWYLDLSSANQAKNDDEDADEEEPRGHYTTKLIKAIVDDAKDEKLKLIIVYTGETDLSGITTTIYKHIGGKNSFKKKECCIFTSNIVILIRAKYSSEDQYKHLKNLKTKVVKNEDLPDIIVTEYANLIKGLVSNFALSAIAAIRENTSRILNVYSPRLDAAYLGHKIALPNPDDAKLLLIKLFGESITDLISSIDIDTNDWIKLWTYSHYSRPSSVEIKGKNIEINRSIIMQLIQSHEKRFDDLGSFIKSCFRPTQLSNAILNEILKNGSSLFQHIEKDPHQSNLKFAKLTHHKNLFRPLSIRPYLTLGTIVRLKQDKKDYIEYYYYLCIQQRCDSSRITNSERRFLFLPLSSKGKKGDHRIIINSQLHLSIKVSSYDIKTIRFFANPDKKIVEAISIKDKITHEKRYVFKSIYNEEYEWVLDLKEAHAQRIVNEYCATLSRVGLDESEWLRSLE